MRSTQWISCSGKIRSTEKRVDKTNGRHILREQLKHGDLGELEDNTVLGLRFFLKICTNAKAYSFPGKRILSKKSDFNLAASTNAADVHSAVGDILTLHAMFLKVLRGIKASEDSERSGIMKELLTEGYYGHSVSGKDLLWNSCHAADFYKEI